MRAWKRRKPILRAIAEFVVIVVGVLTALAVDEWHQASNDERLRQEYLRGLAEDINDEPGYLDYVANLSRARITAADRVLLFLHEVGGPTGAGAGYVVPTDVSGDSVATDFSEASRMQFFVPEAVVWEDLMTTGNLRLIRDPTVRHTVSRYYTQIRYQTRDLGQLQNRFEALSTYLISNGVSSSTATGIQDHVSRLRGLAELSAHVRNVRDTQAEVLQRTLSLREYADTALASVTR